MKNQARDAGLLALGFAIGAALTLVFTPTPARVPTAAPMTVAANKPANKVAVVRYQGSLAGTNSNPAADLPPTSQSMWFRPTKVQFPGSRNLNLLPVDLDLPSPRSLPSAPNVDLIDLRYKPDLKAEDLR
jgi:hypothetical protein